MNGQVLAIATTENVYLFRSLGFETYVISDLDKTKQVIEKIASQAKIIVIDENLQSLINDYRTRLDEQAFPIIIALPIDQQATGQGLEKLRSDVEKAIGLRLF